MESLPNEVLLDIFFRLKCTDLLPCRLMSKRWNSLTTETLQKKRALVTLSTRMEAKCFLHLAKHKSANSIFTRIRLALNTIPIEVLTNFAENFAQNTIELTLFRQHEKTHTDNAILYTKAYVLLQKLPGITYLKIESSTSLLIDLPDKTERSGFPKFENLKKIVWNENNKTLLLKILPKAPALRILEIKDWSENRMTSYLSAAPIIMKNLPSMAFLKAAIPSYNTQNATEIAHISKMCQLPNKISDLEVKHLTIFFDDEEPTPATAWRDAMTQLLQSQSTSLKNLDFRCHVCFNMPKLRKLEFLKMRKGSNVEINPSSFPSLRKLAVRGEFSRKDVLGEKVWNTVRSLEMLWEENSVAVSHRFLNKIELNFPNLEILTIAIEQFLQLVQFCQNNTVPAAELRVYGTKCELLKSGWEAIWENTSELLSQGYPSIRNQREEPRMGLLGLKTLRMLDVEEGVLKFADFASRWGTIKLNMLEISLYTSSDFEDYQKRLGLYHNIVSIYVSEVNNENSDNETEHYASGGHELNCAF